MTEPRIIATIDARSGYDGLIVAVRARVAETGLNSRMIDELSGLTAGYTGKLLGGARIELFGMASLLAISATLGLAFDVKIDPEQEALMRPHWEPGKLMQRRPNRLARLSEATIRRVLPSVASEMGRRGGKSVCNPSAKHAARSKGGKARKRNMTKLQRQQSARKAAVARWAKRNAHRDILIVTGEQK
jgi:hypothetical protein